MEHAQDVIYKVKNALPTFVGLCKCKWRTGPCVTRYEAEKHLSAHLKEKSR